MVDLWVKMHPSRYLVPENKTDYVALEGFASGALLRVSVRKPRRKKHHRLYFGVINVAFDNWPERHPFQPDDTEHLRAWLQCQALHCDTYGEPLRNDGHDIERMLEFTQRAMQKIKAAGGHGFFAEHNGAIVLFTPKSVAYDKLDEAEFRKVSQPVFDVIERETGMTVEALLEAANGLDEREES
jgi:hypothetical protein